MGLFDAFKKAKIKRVDKKYGIYTGTNELNAIPGREAVVGVVSKEAESDFAQYLKADKAGYQIKNLFYLYEAAKKGHPEANKLVREKYFDVSYANNPDAYHQAWYRHLYRCAEKYKFDWAIEEFHRLMIEEEQQMKEAEGTSVVPPKLTECSLTTAEINDIIAKLKSGIRAYEKEKVIHEAVSKGYYFPDNYELIKSIYFQNNGMGSFYSIIAPYYLLNKQDFGAYVLKFSDSAFNSNSRPVAEQGLRELAKSSRLMQDKIPLAKYYLLCDPVPAKIVRGLMIYKEAAERGKKVVAEHMKNDYIMFSRQEAGDAWAQVCRSNKYTSPFDLFYALQCYREGGLYEAGAQLIYEYIKEGGYENNTSKLFGTNNEFLKTVKEFDTAVYGGPQFKYDLEVRKVFAPAKQDIEASEFFDILYREFMKRDSMDWGVPGEGASYFLHIKNTFKKGELEYMVMQGKKEVIFNFIHEYDNNEFIKLAKITGAYPSLLLKSTMNENTTLSDAARSYEYAVANEGFNGTFDDFLAEKNIQYVKDPIKGAEKKCIQQWIIDKLNSLYTQLLKKYRVLYKGQFVQGRICIESISK